MHSALPEQWIDALFARLTGLYGNRFTNMWANIEPQLVRNTWAVELAGVRPEAIRYALEHLPDEFPPTALQFKKICFMCPEQAPALPNNKTASPEVVRTVLQALQRPVGESDPKAWAYRLKVRHEAGERLNANQIRCYRNALFLHPNGEQR